MPAKRTRSLLPRTIARRAALLAADKKAIDLVVLDLRKVTDFADFFVICSGAVDVHVKAIGDNIENELRKQGVKPLHVEGTENLRWMLIDYVDVIIHIFQPDARSYYQLEKLWGDAHRVKISGID